MARTVTLTKLRTQVRQRADQENSGFIKSSEIDTYINQSYTELYDLLVAAYGEDYYQSDPYQIVTNDTDEKYDLPDDFYKLVGVQLRLTNSEALTLRKFEFHKRNYYGWPGQHTLTADENIRYRLSHDQIWFVPKPRGTKTIEIIYVPAAPLLSNGSDTLNGVNGWEEYIIIDAAIKCLIKEESDISPLTYQLDKMRDRLNRMRQNRDAGFAESVTDVSRLNNYYYSDNDSY